GDHPLDGLLERGRSHLVASLAPSARRAEQPGIRQRGELLRDRLPRDRQPGRELRCCRRAACCHRLDERTAAGVTERGEDAVYAPASAVHASACSSSAGAKSGDVSTTRTSVPASTVSSSIATLPPSSQSRTSRSASSSSRTTARRSSPSP